MAALQKVPFTVNVGSLRTDTDARILPPGAGVLELENCVMSQTGAASKRNGNAALSTSIAPSGTLPNVWQLAKHKGALVALPKVNDHALAIESPATGKFSYPLNEVLRGPIGVKRFPYAGDGNGGYNTDLAISGNYVALGFCTTTAAAANPNNYVQQIIDTATGKVLYTYISASSVNSFMGHVVSVGSSYFVHAWVNVATGGSVFFSRWTIANLGTSGTPTQVAAATGQSFSSGGASIELDLLVTGVDEVTAIWIGSTGALMASKFTVSTATAGAAFQLKDSAGVAITGNVAQFIATIAGSPSPTVLTAASGAGLKGHVYGSGLSSNATTSTVIDAGATTTSAVMGYSASTTDYVALYEIPGSPVVLTDVKVATIIAGAPTLGTFQTASLVSKAATLSDGQVYAVFRYPSTVQPSFFLIRLPSNPVTNNLQPPQARFSTWSAFFGQGIAATKGNSLTQLVAYAGGLLGAFSKNVRLKTTNGVVTYDHGVNLKQFTTNDATGRPREAADGLFIPTGVLSCFDGNELREAAWSVYPELTSISYSNPPGGLVAGQSYQWIAIFKWIDAAGRVHRSVQSVALSGVVTAGNTAATLTVTMPRLSSGGGGLVELYRTTATSAGGTTYYLAATTSISTATSTKTILDTVSDANLVAGEILYTQGGVLSSQPPPPLSCVAQFDQRVVGISAEDKSLLWMTTQFVDGEAPRWNEVLTTRINDQYGDCTGQEVMDDKWVVFKANAVYAINGVGPDALGSGGYNPPQLIAIGDGLPASQVLSTIATSDGIYFLSARGICLLTRGLQVQFIGQPMQTYTASFTCTGVVHMPDVNQIRWYSAAGTTIVYDYLHQIWGIHTGQATSSAVIWNGLPVLADATGANLYQEAAGVYLDRGATFAQKITLPNLSLAGLRGYERLYRVQGIGQCADATTAIGVTFTYDFDVSTAHEQLVTPRALWDWEARPARQTATTVKLTVRETLAGGGGQGFVMNGVTLVYGQKTGLRPVAKTQRAV